MRRRGLSRGFRRLRRGSKSGPSSRGGSGLRCADRQPRAQEQAGARGGPPFGGGLGCRGPSTPNPDIARLPGRGLVAPLLVASGIDRLFDPPLGGFGGNIQPNLPKTADCPPIIGRSRALLPVEPSLKFFLQGFQQTAWRLATSAATPAPQPTGMFPTRHPF